MPYFLLGLSVLAIILVTINWLAHTTPDKARKMLGASSAILFLALTVLLVASGRFMAALPSALAAAMVYRRYRRVFNLYQNARAWMGRRSGHGADTGSDASEVRTSHLAMTMDHSSGSLHGEVLQGNFQGKKTSELSEADLFSLLAELQAVDEDGARLLQTFLDREANQGWRQRYDGNSSGERQTGTPQGGPLTLPEAYRVLGLDEGASDGDIKAAHKKLMLKLHPDQGGSDYLASKINEAKDLLLAK